MDAATREYVCERAKRRCEYCQFPEEHSGLPFHIEHIIATVHRIDEGVANLAWPARAAIFEKALTFLRLIL